MNLPKMQALEVAYSDIENAVLQENLTMSGGELVTNEFRRTIRIIGEFEKPEEIENVIVKSENQKPVFIKDFATVDFAFKERTSIARADQLPVISLNVIKRQGENVIDAADKIKELII